MPTLLGIYRPWPTLQDPRVDKEIFRNASDWGGVGELWWAVLHIPHSYHQGGRPGVAAAPGGAITSKHLMDRKNYYFKVFDCRSLGQKQGRGHKEKMWMNLGGRK